MKLRMLRIEKLGQHLSRMPAVDQVLRIKLITKIGLVPVGCYYSDITKVLTVALAVDDDSQSMTASLVLADAGAEVASSWHPVGVIEYVFDNEERITAPLAVFIEPGEAIGAPPVPVFTSKELRG